MWSGRNWTKLFFFPRLETGLKIFVQSFDRENSNVSSNVSKSFGFLKIGTHPTIRGILLLGCSLISHFNFVLNRVIYFETTNIPFSNILLFHEGRGKNGTRKGVILTILQCQNWSFRSNNSRNSARKSKLNDSPIKIKQKEGKRNGILGRLYSTKQLLRINFSKSFPLEAWRIGMKSNNKKRVPREQERTSFPNPFIVSTRVANNRADFESQGNPYLISPFNPLPESRADFLRLAPTRKRAFSTCHLTENPFPGQRINANDPRGIIGAPTNFFPPRSIPQKFFHPFIRQEAWSVSLDSGDSRN